MVGMDASQSALDSLRTVEFRETLKGYHRDDVDEYLEKAAVEAEGLQEQLRQSGERLRQAAERIAQLETAIEHRPEPTPVEPAAPDDTLQRTLLLAQKFVDETKAESEAEAARIIAEADAKARLVTEQSQAQANRVAAESEQRLREEISRLEANKAKLAHDVETMSRHLETERGRLRDALSEILRWVDENVQPVGGHPEAARVAPKPEAGTTGPPTGGVPAPGSQPQPAPAAGNRPAAVAPQPQPQPQAQPQPQPQAQPHLQSAATPHPGNANTGEMTQVRPAGSNAPAQPAEANAPLPL